MGADHPTAGLTRRRIRIPPPKKRSISPQPEQYDLLEAAADQLRLCGWPARGLRARQGRKASGLFQTARSQGRRTEPPASPAASPTVAHQMRK